MAVEDKYVNTDRAADKPGIPAKVAYAPMLCSVETEEIAAADDDGSVYRFFTVPMNLIPVQIDLLHDTIASGTDFDLGLYRSQLGAVIDKDVFADGLDLSSGSSKDGLTTVDATDRTKRIFEHAGDTTLTRLSEYDIALTGNTVGSGAGTVTLIMLWAQG